MAELNKPFEIRSKSLKKWTWRQLRISLKYRPEIIKLIVKLKNNIHSKKVALTKLKQQLKLQVIPSYLIQLTGCI